jgi:hypothetical protein
MSIYGVGSSNASRLTPQLPLRDNARTQTQVPTRPAVVPSSGQLALQQPANAKGAQQSVPVEPPAGTDPALWSVLSGEERAFFAKSGAMGPLTYGRALRDMNVAQMPASRGGRLDVKV